MRLAAILFVSCLPAFTQTSLSLPGCEPRADVGNTIEEKLSSKALRNLKWREASAKRREVLEDLIAKYPREYEPHRTLISTTRRDNSDRLPVLQDRYRQQAAQNPDDPLALLLAGYALIGTDTTESIRLLEAARAKAPGFALPLLELADIYSSGRNMDKKKAAEDLAAFLSACPVPSPSLAGITYWLLPKLDNGELQKRTAVELRARLATETNPEHLQDGYETLWGLEFRTRTPQEHDALRKQVAGDLKRLEALNPNPDPQWLGFLKGGYKQSGASKADLDALDDRLLREFPKSDEAYRIAWERWRNQHKEPEEQKDVAAWAKYNRDYQDAVKGWMRGFTGARSLSDGQAWFFAIRDDSSLAEKEGVAAMETWLKTAEEGQPWPYHYASAAQFLLDHKWQPKRALVLLHKAETLFARQHAEKNDNLSADDLRDQEREAVGERQMLAGLMLKAARMAKQPEEARRLKASIEGPPPPDKRQVSAYWLNRARLAAIENRKTDALAYYQSALTTRAEAPRWRRGRLHDDLTDEARALWNETGGTATAWDIWSKPAESKGNELAEGRWEKPKKSLPAFELTDLTGKTWRLRNLEGKSVLINLWATWCGPCQAELPRLQKLYDKVKERPDIQIVTFNIDEDLGLVAPLVKEKGYTFPVLPAYGLVMELFDSGWSIPENWLVDPKGAWRWTQVGFDAADSEWVETMTQRLESVKNGS